jgi:hypothetical protein
VKKYLAQNNSKGKAVGGVDDEELCNKVYARKVPTESREPVKKKVKTF